MDDSVDPVERPANGFAVADVADDELHVLVEIVGAVSALMHLRLEVVERPDIRSLREQPVGEVRADEPRAACDQDFHGRGEASSAFARAGLDPLHRRRRRAARSSRVRPVSGAPLRLDAAT